MDMGIVNAGQLGVYEEIDAGAARARRGRGPEPRADATERLLEIADRFKGEAATEATSRTTAWRALAGDEAARRTRWSRASTSSSTRTPRRRASELASPLDGDRRAADGRHERRRRPVRRRQDVPAAGGQVGAGDEEGGRATWCRSSRRRRTARNRRANGRIVHGHREGRRARHRQEHRRRRAAVQQLRGHRPGRDGAGDRSSTPRGARTPTSSGCPG